MWLKLWIVSVLLTSSVEAQTPCHGLFAAFYLKTDQNELVRSAEETYRELLIELGSALSPDELVHLAKKDPYEISNITNTTSESLREALSNLRNLVAQAADSTKIEDKVRSRLKKIAGEMGHGMTKAIQREEKNSLENLNGRVMGIPKDLKFLKSSTEGSFVVGVLNESKIVVVDRNNIQKTYELEYDAVYTPVVSEQGRLYFAAEKKLLYADLLDSRGLLKKKIAPKLFQQDEKFIGHGTLSFMGDGQTLMQDWLSTARFFTKEGNFIRGINESGPRIHFYEPSLGMNYLLRPYTNGRTELRTLAFLDLTDTMGEPIRIPFGKKKKSSIEHVWVAVPGRDNSEILLVIKDRPMHGRIEEPELYRFDIKTRTKKKMELSGPLNKKNDARTFRRFLDVAALKSKDTVLFSGFDITLGDYPLQKIFYLLNPQTGQTREFNLMSRLQDSADVREFFGKIRGGDFQVELVPGSNNILIWNEKKTLFVRIDITEFLPGW